MKNIITAIIFTLSLTAFAFAQDLTKVGVGTLVIKAEKPRIAVLEFTAGPDVPAGAQSMNNLKQISLGVVDTMKKDKTDKGWIEIPSTQQNAQEFYRTYLGRPIDPVGAAKIGKLLGADYVMTGHVKVFDGAKIGLQTQMVKVSSGSIVWNGPVILAGDWNSDGSVSSADYTPTRNGNLQITQFAIKPAIQKLTASLKAADL